MEIELDYSVYSLLNHLAGTTLLLPLAVGITRFGKLSAPLRILCLLLGYSVLNTAITMWLAALEINNLFFFNIYTIVELALIGWVFHTMFGSKNMKITVSILVITVLVFALSNILFMQNVDILDNLTLGVESLLFTLLALLFFYKVFRESKVQQLERYPLFWLNSGMLLYFAGNLFVFIFSNYILMETQNVFHAEWGIHSILQITSNLIYTIGIWLSTN